MGCGDACPIFPGKRYLDWQLEDQAGKGVESVRPIRDEIEQRIRRLADLGVSAAASSSTKKNGSGSPRRSIDPQPDVIGTAAGRRR